MLKRVLVADNGLPTEERKGVMALAQAFASVGHNVGFRLLDLFDVNEQADLVIIPKISRLVDKIVSSLHELNKEFVVISLISPGAYRVATSSGHSIRSLEELSDGLYQPKPEETAPAVPELPEEAEPVRTIPLRHRNRKR